MSKNQLENCACAFLSKSKGHCLLFTYNEVEKEVEIVVDDVWVNDLQGNIFLMNELYNCMQKQAQESLGSCDELLNSLIQMAL